MNAKQMNSKGAALPLAVMAGVVLLIVSFSVLSLGRYFRLQGSKVQDTITARLAADTGLTKAVYDMQQKLDSKLWSDADLPGENSTLPDSFAKYGYTVTGNMANGYIVESTGQFRSTTKKVSAELVLGGGLFEHGIYVKDSLDLDNSVELYGYNFDPDDKIPLQVATASTGADKIILRNSAKVFGDVRAGFGGDPDVVIDEGNSIEINGEKGTLSTEWDPPIVNVPAHVLAMPSQGTLTGGTITQSGRYDAIDLGNGKELKIKGDVIIYVSGEVTFGNSAKLIMEDKSSNSLALYFGGDLLAINSNEINNETEDPRKMQLINVGSGNHVHINNSVNYYGTIYAPDSKVTLGNSAEIYGALVANDAKFDNSIKFYYDASLRTVDTDDLGVRFVVRNWIEE